MGTYQQTQKTKEETNDGKIISSLNKNCCILNSDKAKQELEDAKNDWDNVDEIIPTVGSYKAPGFASQTMLISFEEVLEYFQHRDMSEYMVNIVPVVTQSRMSSVLRIIFGPERLNDTLEESRKLLFAIASCPLQNDEIIHIRVLQTIYKQLTNSKRDVGRFGPHWDYIGFQGNDPATDLRGVGFLALMHLLYLVTDPSTLSLAKSILKLSHHCTQNFPFAVMGINITRIVLQSVREERLNKECNKAEDVFSVTNKFYAGIFLRLYETWRKDRLTIADCGWVLKGVEYNVKKKPKLVLQSLDSYLKENKGKVKPLNLAVPTIPAMSLQSTPRISHMEPYPMTDIQSEPLLKILSANSMASAYRDCNKEIRSKSGDADTGKCLSEDNVGKTEESQKTNASRIENSCDELFI